MGIRRLNLSLLKLTRNCIRLTDKVKALLMRTRLVSQLGRSLGKVVRG